MALDHAVRQGKALYAGISNYNPEQTRKAAALLRAHGTPCLIHQQRYSMFSRELEAGLSAAIEEAEMGCIVFSPLAQGQLTDRYLQESEIPADSRAAREECLKSEQVKANLPKVRSLHALAEKRGQSLAQMALAWTLRLPAVTSILIGASSVRQLEDNVQALDRLDFSAAELEQIETILKSK